ncbi:MAG: hypothetical protein QOI04_2314 [Verrucomicrobiota bacterium]|jgi:hypothetical protein
MSPLLEPPPTPVRQDRQSPFATPIFRKAIGFAVLLAIAGLLGGGWYLAKKGFGREWRHRVVEELHKRGVEASIRRLTLDPFRGLIAQDVRIFDYKHREKTIAIISEVALDINYAALLHHQPFLNALDVRNAQLTFTFPNADPNAAKARLTRFRAHVYFPPEQIYVSQAEGNFCGVQISARGQLIKRIDFKPGVEISAEEWRARLALLQRVVTELGAMSFPGEAPRLELRFTGDLSDLETARAEATLRGSHVRRGVYEMKDIFANAEWADQKLTVTRFGWNDRAGSLVGHASWRREHNDADFEMRSTLDLKSFLAAFRLDDFLKEMSFSSPPTVELSGSANFSTPRARVKVLGRASVENFVCKNVPFASFATDFSWDGERSLLRNIRLRHESGALAADILDAPNDLRINIDSSLNPGALVGFAPAELQKFFNEWEWQRPPSVHLAIRGSNHDATTWSGDGTVALQRTRFRGVAMNSASANVRFGNGAITYDNFRIVRDEGSGSGSFTYDFSKHEVHVVNVRSTLRPSEAIFWIDPDLAKPVAPYKFHKPPSVTANGVVQFRGGKNTHLEINVDAPSGMDYVFLDKTLAFDRVGARLLFTDDRLQLNDVQGNLFSGTVQGNADISLAKNDSHYSAKLSVDGIDFPRLTDLYFKYQTSRGRLNGTYNFTGLGSNPRSMQGTGTIRVTDGDVFAIPIFGPLSDLLTKIIPGVGYSVARKADATFSIKDGVIHTDDFDVAGKLFGMIGHGDVHFLDDKLDFDVRINASGAGVLLAPMYKLFEYKGEGSLSHPNWHSKRF